MKCGQSRIQPGTGQAYGPSRFHIGERFVIEGIACFDQGKIEAASGAQSDSRWGAQPVARARCTAQGHRFCEQGFSASAVQSSTRSALDGGIRVKNACRHVGYDRTAEGFDLAGEGFEEVEFKTAHAAQEERLNLQVRVNDRWQSPV